MTDLEDFLQARIEEDRRRAQHALADWDSEDEIRVWRGLVWEHFDYARHLSPERVLRDLDAKQRIVRLCAEENEGVEIGVGVSPEQWLAQNVLRLLALPYANHPDYREEWRP